MAADLVDAGVPTAAPFEVPATAEGGDGADSAGAFRFRGLDEARPLPGTAYKIEIARALIRRAREAVSDADAPLPPCPRP